MQVTPFAVLIVYGISIILILYNLMLTGRSILRGDCIFYAAPLAWLTVIALECVITDNGGVGAVAKMVFSDDKMKISG